MNNFEYGLQAYLAAVQTMNHKELRATGLNQDYQKTVLTQSYPLKKETEKDVLASYSYRPSWHKDHFKIEAEHYGYNQEKLENVSFATALGVAGHEVMHSVQAKNIYADRMMSPQKKTFCYTAATLFAANMAATFTMPQFSASFFAGASSGAAIAIGAYLTEKTHLNKINFKTEKDALIHQGAMLQIFDEHADFNASVISVVHAIANKKSNKLARLRDEFIDGYPSFWQMHDFMAQGRIMAKNASLQYDEKHVDKIKKLTDSNIKSNKFRIYHID